MIYTAWVRLWGWIKPRTSKSGKRGGREETPASDIGRDQRTNPAGREAAIQPRPKMLLLDAEVLQEPGGGFLRRLWQGTHHILKEPWHEASLPPGTAVVETRTTPEWTSQGSKERAGPTLPTVTSDNKRWFSVTRGRVYFSCFLAKYAKHKIYNFNHFLVYSSVALSTFILLCNHRHYPSPELSSSPTRLCAQETSPSPSFPPGPGNHHSTLFLYEPDYSRYLR